MNNVIVLQPEDRSEIVLNKLSELSTQVTDNFCEIADLLLESWEHQYHKTWGYDSFADYTEQKLDIKGGKSYFLVKVAKTVKKLGIPWQDVREVGWRKTAAIAGVLNHDNAKLWIQEAKQLPLAHLSEKVKAEKEGRKASEDPPIRMTFQFDAEEHTIVTAALEKAKREEDAKGNSKAFVRICYNFFMSQDEVENG